MSAGFLPPVAPRLRQTIQPENARALSYRRQVCAATVLTCQTSSRPNTFQHRRASAQGLAEIAPATDAAAAGTRPAGHQHSRWGRYFEEGRQAGKQTHLKSSWLLEISHKKKVVHIQSQTGARPSGGLPKPGIEERISYSISISRARFV